MPAKPATDVTAFLAACRHPLLDVLNTLRATVAGADRRLVEGAKWNAPSFRLGDGDDCVTFNLSAKDRVRIVFHRGAKKKDTRGGGRLVADDGGLVEWAADDRAIASFGSLADAKAAKADLAAFVRAWLAAIA